MASFAVYVVPFLLVSPQVARCAKFTAILIKKSKRTISVGGSSKVSEGNEQGSEL
jgi:hypothetical protein